MGKIIFYVLIIVGLCFGQSIWLKENPKINLPMPMNISIKSANGTDGIAERKVSFYSSQNLSLIKFLGPNVLFMQVEGESLKPKTSFWKQAGIYGFEGLGAGVGAFVSLYLSAIMTPGDPEYFIEYGLPYYYIVNVFLTSSSTWATGKLLRQDGSWRNSLIGTGIGSLGGILSIYHDIDWWPGALIFSASGAVIGFNIK